MSRASRQAFDARIERALGDGALQKVIAEGQGKMHPIASVTPAAADNVVAYLRTLKK